MVVLSVGARDGGSRRVASRVSRTRAHAEEFGFDTALGGNALAKRRPWRERAGTEDGIARASRGGFGAKHAKTSRDSMWKTCAP